VTAPSGEQFEIGHGEQRLCAVEVGGGVRTYRSGDRDVLLGYALDEMCTGGRGQVLAPWPNRIEDGAYAFDGRTLQLPLTEPEKRNAIHGLVRWTTWRAVEHEVSSVALEHVLHPQPGYPFTLALRVEYRLDDAGLTVESTATNVGSGACPLGLGHHPYLAGAVDELTVRVPARDQIVADERGLPEGRGPAALHEPQRIGARRIDTAFAELKRDLDGLARVRVGDAVLWLDHAFPFVQLFTGDLPGIDRRGLAVEPMTCAPNAFRTGEGLLRLEPGESFRGRWGIHPASP